MKYVKRFENLINPDLNIDNTNDNRLIDETIALLQQAKMNLADMFDLVPEGFTIQNIKILNSVIENLKKNKI